jgi:hypothetical protein
VCLAEEREHFSRMNATIRLVISARRLRPTSGRRARSSGPASLIPELVALFCVSCSLVRVSPPVEPLRLGLERGRKSAYPDSVTWNACVRLGTE